jgi:outer membrane receptor protein involved in Fe transport
MLMTTFHPVLADTMNSNAPTTDLPAIEVVGVTPLKGMEQARDDIAGHVQSLDRRTLREQSATALPELLNERFTGVNVNEIQGNPFQADVNYRGFTASPLLGAPQGLSLYQDGVRVNEPFGDTVNWDLIPRQAISTIDLIPGANPLFGLNTLGGALSLQTKDGFTAPGGELEAYGGRFGQRSFAGEFGRAQNEWAVYLAATRFDEDGWRDFSPSRVEQLFGKLSYRTDDLRIDLSHTHADNDLTGNGLLPGTMQRADYASIFTRPDNTRNRLDLLNLNVDYWLNDASRLTTLLYYRENLTRTLNGDVNDEFEEDPLLDGAAGANGGLGFNLQTGANNRTNSDQRGWGGALQWSWRSERHQLALGTTVDQSRTAFQQTTELGICDPRRGVSADFSGQQIDNQLLGRTSQWSLFVQDVYQPISPLSISTALRYNRVRVIAVDQLNPGMPNNLDGDFIYTKLNPSLGATWHLTPGVAAYATLAQGNRAPSPIELGCADPVHPCSLPNAMQSDPYLKQVVTRSIEAGLRGGEQIKWNATAYAANNHDDILFVGTSPSQGYFTNFGQTRRVGAELGLSGAAGALNWRAGYSYVKATYQSAACLLSPNNSSRGQTTACSSSGQDDEILVRSGNRIPGIPAHQFKLGADYSPDARWTLSATLNAFSRQYARGNENNAHRPGSATDLFGVTRTFLGNGEVAGYALLNLGARATLARDWELFFQLRNVFDRRYASAGALAENPFDAAGVFRTNSDNWQRETFYAPGAPRNFQVGLRIAFK